MENIIFYREMLLRVVSVTGSDRWQASSLGAVALC